jgi:hypothetical protein
VGRNYHLRFYKNLRKFFDKKAIKKTLTLPNWLNTLAERDGVNFSAVLQEALIAKLNLDV